MENIKIMPAQVTIIEKDNIGAEMLRTFSRTYMWMCVALVTTMILMTFKYKALVIFSSGMLFFKIVLFAVVVLAIWRFFRNNEKEQSVEKALRFTWDEM
jgi:preprotein translocase subunit SecD